MHVLGALVGLLLAFAAGVGVLALAGYAFALFLKHATPARLSWRHLLASLRMED